MKFTQKKIQQIIKEELNKLLKENPGLAQALMGKAGLGPQNEPTRAGRSGEKMGVELGPGVPEKDDVISAAELLKIIPKNRKDLLTVYNVATFLKTNPDASPQELVKVVMDAREEADTIKIDEPYLEEESVSGDVAGYSLPLGAQKRKKK